MVAAFGLLATIDHTTNLVLLSGYLFLLGVGMGLAMQNLVLAVQNAVAARDLGAASSTVSFFRSLGGTVGVSVLGAVLATHVATLTATRLPAGAGPAGIGNLAELPAEVAAVVRESYGDGTALIFLVAALLSVVSLIAVLAIEEVPLSTETGIERARAEAAREAPAGRDAVPGSDASTSRGRTEICAARQ